MLAFAMALWSLAVWPFVIKTRLYLDQHYLPNGITEIRTIGISMKISWSLMRGANGLEIQIRYLKSNRQRNDNVKDMEQMRDKIGPLILSAPYLRENIISYLRKLHIISTFRIGLGDAAQTALACGALSTVFGCIPHARGNVIPDFRNVVFHADIKCIAALQLGKLLLSAVLILRAAATQYIRRKVGGVIDGKTASD